MRAHGRLALLYRPSRYAATLTALPTPRVAPGIEIGRPAGT